MKVPPARGLEAWQQEARFALSHAWLLRMRAENLICASFIEITRRFTPRGAFAMTGQPTWSCVGPSSAMFERIDKLGTQVGYVGHIARRESHAMNFGCRREQGIHGGNRTLGAHASPFIRNHPIDR